jgi:hypothetical protein
MKPGGEPVMPIADPDRTWAGGRSDSPAPQSPANPRSSGRIGSGAQLGHAAEARPRDTSPRGRNLLPSYGVVGASTKARTSNRSY